MGLCVQTQQIATSPPSQEIASRRALLAALVLASIASALLRLVFLQTQSLWLDETYTVHILQTRSLDQLWQAVGASESTPPLYYLLNWLWVHLLASTSAAAVRALSALGLISCVPVSYAALRRLVGERAALVTAALVAVSPLLSWYALDARAYGLLVLTGLLSVWTFSVLLTERPTRRRFALWALTGAVTIWTHWFGGWLVLSEALVLLWLRPKLRLGTLLASLGVLLSLAPLLELLRRQTGDTRAAFIAGSSLQGRLEQLVRQFATGVNVPRTWLEAASLAVALSAVAWGTSFAARRAAHDERLRALLALTGISLLAPLLLAALGIYDRFNLRNVLFLWPLIAALAAPALLRLRGLPLIALLTLNIFTWLWTQADWRYQNPDWQSALARIATADSAVPVIALTQSRAPVAELYLRRTANPAPLAITRAWLVVEPTRTSNSRALLAAHPAVLDQLLSVFPEHREQLLHGFRLIAVRSRTPVTVKPVDLPQVTVLGP